MLEAQNISYHLGSKPLFSSLSFSLKPGEVIGVRGKNGAGKTTLLRLLAGLIRPSSGALFWKGETVTSAYPQNLLYRGHALCLHPEGCIKDHLYMWRNLYGVSDQTLEKALHLWGLEALKKKKVSHLSQGQQKRLSLSRCSWLDRSLWILDEPHAGLDSEGKTLLSQQIESYLKRGGMVILATHEKVPCSKEVCL